MSGPINEAADFGPIRFATRLPIEIDMDEVSMINSVGLRNFGNWAIALKNPVIELAHVPKFFVDQLNMIPDLIPRYAKVVSFYVPYFNGENELEKRVLYRKGLEFDRADGAIKLTHPQVTDADKNTYEIDVIPAKFFRFLEKYA
jgi:hypothetical protein